MTDVDTRGNKTITGTISILFVISNLEYGGAQRQIVELANNMDPNKFDVHICSLSSYTPLSSLLFNSTTRLHIIQKQFKYDISVIPKLAILMKRIGTDIVHNFLFDAEIAGRLAGLIAGVNAIVGSERNTDYHLKKRQLAAYRITRSLVDLVVANSNAGAQFNRKKLGVDHSRYRVVHNGVDVSKFKPGDGLGKRKELGIEDDECVVGMFASLKQQKNHPLFFQAARHLLEKNLRIRFLIVGDMLYDGMHGSDDYKKMVGQLVDDLKIRDRCLFLGNRDDVADLYLACDVTVLPSFFEGTPNVLLESMACGVPVIATNVSDNAYILQDGQVGVLVPLGDPGILAGKISDILANKNRRSEMGNTARDWVTKNFSSESLARKYEVIYTDLYQSKIH